MPRGAEQLDEKLIDPADLLTPDELAARLKVPKSWVLEHTRARGPRKGKRMPFFYVGRYPRFHWPSVSQWLANNKR
jgi:hypothetical protein